MQKGIVNKAEEKCGVPWQPMNTTDKSRAESVGEACSVQQGRELRTALHKSFHSSVNGSLEDSGSVESAVYGILAQKGWGLNYKQFHFLKDMAFA